MPRCREVLGCRTASEFYATASSGNLQTSTQVLPGVQAASSSGARAMALLELPQAGYTTSKRRSDSSRYTSHREGAHAAHRVADALLGLFSRKHARLGSKLGLELRVRNAGISRAHHERHSVAHGKRQRLGNARRLAAHGLSRQLHGCAGCGEFHNIPLAPEFRKIRLHLIDRHLAYRLSPPSSTLWNNSTTHISGKP